jgi:transcriptional regulator GlxA family with amidase domain
MKTLLAASLCFVALAVPAHSAEPPLKNIGFLVLPGVYNSELMAPYDVFHHLRFHVKDAPAVFTVAPHEGAVRTFEGLSLQPAYTFKNAPPIDLLVVPSAEHNMDADLRDKALLDWVKATGDRARYVLSLCDGGFILAKAGLLDGLEATTFPGDQDRFGEWFPALRLQRGPLFVHDGKAITSVGGARSYEPALYLVEKLYGRQVALKIGEGLVIDWKLASLGHRLAPGAK